MNNSRIEAREELISVIHRALVEVMTLKQANLPLKFFKEAFHPTNEYKHRIAKGARFEMDTGGQTSVVLEHEDLQQMILDHIQLQEPKLEESEQQEEDHSDEESWEELPEELPDDQTVEARDLEENSGSAIEPQETEAINNESTEMLESLSEEEDISETEYDESAYKPADDSWLRMSFADVDFKFAVGLFCGE